MAAANIIRVGVAPASRSSASSRIVSSISNRGSSSGPASARTRLLSISDSSVSRSAAQIRSAASSVPPPEKTARRAKRARSSSLRSSQLHSIVARSVRWRSGASAAPVVSSDNRRSSRARICSTDRILVRAAASSIASGKLVQASADGLDRRTRAVDHEPGADRPRSLREQGRSPRRATAAVPDTPARRTGGAARGSTSPRRPWARRPRVRRAGGAASGRSCSRLSSTSNTRLVRRCSARASAYDALPLSRTPSVCAIVGSTRAGSVSAASPTNQTPSR